MRGRWIQRLYGQAAGILLTVCFHTSFPADVLDRPKTAHPTEMTFPNPIEPEGKHPNSLPCSYSPPAYSVLQGLGGSSARNNQDRILEMETGWSD